MNEVIEAKEIEVLKRNYLTKHQGNVKKEEQIEYFTKEEMLDKLSRLPPNEYGMLFQFLWRTGVRVTEAISITKKDLDFQNLEIKIRWLKNRKFDTRIIPMHPSLRLPLYPFVAKLNNEDKVFNFTRQYVDQLCKKYSFDHAHKLRHSFAINFLRQSDNPTAFVMLQHILGHSHIETTMVYLRAVPMEQKRALEKINFD
jgi:integrase